MTEPVCGVGAVTRQQAIEAAAILEAMTEPTWLLCRETGEVAVNTKSPAAPRCPAHGDAQCLAVFGRVDAVAAAVLGVVVPRITQAEHDRLLEGLRRLRSEIRGGSLARVHGGYEEALDDVKAMLLGGAGG